MLLFSRTSDLKLSRSYAAFMYNNAKLFSQLTLAPVRIMLFAEQSEQGSSGLFLHPSIPHYSPSCPLFTVILR